nr:hypothetical protein HUO10_002122 [Paraburkholderia busanensis]
MRPLSYLLDSRQGCEDNADAAVISRDDYLGGETTTYWTCAPTYCG